MSRINISIVTVGMNHKHYLIPFLKSLFIDNKPSVSFELIYIDNCSHDGSVEYISEHYPSVKIVVNTKIKGFGENNNIGVGYTNGEFIALINPDIILLPNSLDNLCEYARQNPQTGIVVPELLNPDGTHQFSVRQFISPAAFLHRVSSGLKDHASNNKVADYLCKDIDVSKEQKVNWAIGAMFMIPKNVYDKLGGFDTDYFLYMEDEDLCLRCWKIGYNVVYYPKSQMIHNHIRASSKFGKRSLIHAQSLIKFFFKHGFSIPDFTS